MLVWRLVTLKQVVLFSADVSRLRGWNRLQAVNWLLLCLIILCSAFLSSDLSLLSTSFPISSFSCLWCLSAVSSSSVFLFHLPLGAKWGVSLCSQQGGTVRGKWQRRSRFIYGWSLFASQAVDFSEAYMYLCVCVFVCVCVCMWHGWQVHC